MLKVQAHFSAWVWSIRQDWDLTKVFISPKGAITRLHFDNGGAHAVSPKQTLSRQPPMFS